MNNTAMKGACDNKMQNGNIFLSDKQIIPQNNCRKKLHYQICTRKKVIVKSNARKQLLLIYAFGWTQNVRRVKK